MNMRMKWHRVNQQAKPPFYATTGAVGLDLQTMVAIELAPQKSVRVPTGIAVAVPEGHELTVRPRSSTSGKSLLIHLGTVDADYRGEVLMNITNLGDATYVAAAFERIAQAVVSPIERVVLDEVSDIAGLGTTERGAGGFGSTGVL